MTGVIYARYSSDNQREESIEGQLRECMAFAEKNGITIIGNYIDRAMSARTADRPDFQRMIKDSEKKLFDVVIVWKLDRFSRDRYDSATYKHILKKNGVKVISATENIADGPEGVLLESLLEGLSEYYSAELSQKIHRGQMENALKCKNNGGNIPLGLRTGADGVLEIDPVNSPIVQEIFSRYDSGESITDIVASLNERGIRTAKGLPFRIGSLGTVLKNRKYIGEYHYGTIVIPNKLPVIIDEEQFNRVQMKMEANKHAPARAKADEEYLLTTKLFCGNCGAMLAGESGKSRNGDVYHYYKCGNAKRKKGCKLKAIKKRWMLHSLAAQISYYTSLIEGNPDWIFAGVYSDEGLTGTKASRPGFQKMLDDCRAKNIDMVIVKSISRFARNTLDLLNVVRELKDLGIDVYFEEQNIHSLSGDGELMLSILASYAQEESRSVSENCKWRYRKVFEHGEGINLEKIYGYRQQDGKIVISDDAAQVVRRVFNLYIGGTGAKEIARILNSEGIPTATGKRWSESQVRTMLHNEKYTGNTLLQKTFISDHLTKKKRFNRGELPRYYVEDTHPAIIPQATYDAAEKRMADNREHNGCRPGETWEKHMFTKMIVCPYCGKYFTRKKTKYEVAWVCATYLKQGRDVCRSKKIPEDILEKKAAQVLGTEQVDEAMLRKQVTCIRAYMNNRLTFIMKDGTKTEKTWSDKSRADSWTPEMRMKAAEKAKRGHATCQEK